MCLYFLLNLKSSLLCVYSLFGALTLPPSRGTFPGIWASQARTHIPVVERASINQVDFFAARMSNTKLGQLTQNNIIR